MNAIGILATTAILAVTGSTVPTTAVIDGVVYSNVDDGAAYVTGFDVTPAYDGRGDTNLPCTESGYWVLVHLAGATPPTLTVGGVDAVLVKVVGEGDTAHYLSGPVDENTLVYLTPNIGQLQLSHCVTTQTPTPSPTPAPTDTPSPSLTPTPTDTPAPSESPTASPSSEPSPTPIASEQPTPTPAPSEQPTPTPSPTASPVPTPNPTPTPNPGYVKADFLGPCGDPMYAAVFVNKTNGTQFFWWTYRGEFGRTVKVYKVKAGSAMTTDFVWVKEYTKMTIANGSSVIASEKAARGGWYGWQSKECRVR